MTERAVAQDTIVLNTITDGNPEVAVRGGRSSFV